MVPPDSESELATTFVSALVGGGGWVVSGASVGSATRAGSVAADSASVVFGAVVDSAVNKQTVWTPWLRQDVRVPHVWQVTGQKD